LNDIRKVTNKAKLANKTTPNNNKNLTKIVYPICALLKTELETRNWFLSLFLYLPSESCLVEKCRISNSPP
jgi:hypothetical protein